MVAQAIRNIISPKSVIAQYQKIDFQIKELSQFAI
jgi:hypothetical protein